MVPFFSFFLLVSFIFSFLTDELRSEAYFGASIGKGGGEYVFETGNRFPNLSGIRGGSRISFPRDPIFFGIQTGYFKNKWEVKGGIKSTLWYQQVSEARDEDFALFTVSTERATNVATREFSYYDSVTVYSGTRNFADGKGKSTLGENQFEVFGRYYFKDANPDLWKPSDGFFLTTGLRYSYFKYVFYDVIQFIDGRPPFYGPIGLGLTFSNDLTELFYGLGYRKTFENFYWDAAFMPSQGIIKTRDFHVQRSINFLSDNYGSGWLLTNEFGVTFSDSFLAFFRLTHHRYFSEGRFVSRGGLTQEDIQSNFAGGFRSHINIKDYNFDFGIVHKWDWNIPEAEDFDDESKGILPGKSKVRKR